MTARPFYITTAISYPNGPPHVGHAYEAIAADALARFRRLDGYSVHFVTGTDDYGQKIHRAAREQGVSPRAFVDRLVPRFAEMTRVLAVSQDRFIRTSEAAHHRAVQEIWRRMEAAGDIYPGVYSGWYSVREEEFYAESDLRRSEDGERCSPSGAPVEWVEEESYFFRLSSYGEKLLAHYAAHPEFIGPRVRRNEVVRFVEGGLRDLSITRTSFDWGVPAPDKPGHIVYVWLDALTNYLTAANWPDAAPHWPADLHLIGKDVVRFHAVYWPAFLMSAGLPLPKRVFAHGMVLTAGGEKMSKSLGNAIDPFDLARNYGVDQMRYFFLREPPFGEDGFYSHEAMLRRINSDLANDLGNLARRALVMAARDCAGRIPEPAGSPEGEGRALLDKVDGLLPPIREAMAIQRIDQSLALIFEAVAAANRYFAGEEPWKLARSDPPRQKEVLYTTLEALRQIVILLQPVMPLACAELLDQLGAGEGARNFACLGEAGRLKAGPLPPEFKIVFPRMQQAGRNAR